MMKFHLAFVLLFIATCSFSQDVSTKYSYIINEASLRTHLTVIAGAEMEGRETGTEGERRAAAYIERFFDSVGITMPQPHNSYRQYFPLGKDSALKMKLEWNNKDLAEGVDFLVPASGNDEGKFESKEWVFIGYGIESENYNDYTNLDVKGKTVIMFLGEPKKDGKYLTTGTDISGEWTYPGLEKKLELAFEKGATGALVVSPTMETFAEKFAASSRRTSLTFLREKKKRVNYALISHDMAKKILKDNSLIHMAKTSTSFTGKHFSKKQKIDFKYSEHRALVQSSNVIGIIEGSDKKDEFVFLTAHYDHLGIRNGNIYYGADDDGSGTVAIMHLGAAFAKAKAEGKGPRRTVVVLAFSGEEKGLWGSEFYSDNPIFPLEKTSVDLNIDMIGRVDTERTSADSNNYVYVVGHDKISTDLPVISETMNNKYTGLVFDYKFDDPKDPSRIYFRSDHYNFARKGVPVLFFYDGMLKADYHKPTDTVDKIHWSLYEKRARMVFHTAWEMANRDEMLIRNLPIPNGKR
jgi:Zn-dependent M28 family amino/carboxypeptidase